MIEAPLNPNYSRSFLFGYAIPFTHTGILFNYPFNEQLSMNIGVVNGWDNVVDNNDGKTLLGNIAFTTGPAFSFIVNGTYGPEKTNTSSKSRGVVDLVSLINVDPLSVVLNFDYGSEDGVALDGGSAKWYGFAGIVGLALKDATGLPAGVFLRGEVFRDDGGARTGTDQQLWEMTLTGKYYVSDKFTIWTEYRHDGSDEDSFAKDGHVDVVDPTSGDTTTVPKCMVSQATLSIAASYGF